MKREITILRLPRTVLVRENVSTPLKSCQIRQPRAIQPMDLLTMVPASESHYRKAVPWKTRRHEPHRRRMSLAQATRLLWYRAQVRDISPDFINCSLN